MLVPQALAYAQLSGMPAYRGLYAAALPPIVAALFASSPYLQTGPVALTSLLTFGALATLAPVGSNEYVGLGALLALVVGAVRLAIGLLRAEVVAYLVSQPMLIGFVPGAALVILASQLPTALGARHVSRQILHAAVTALAHPHAWAAASLAVAACTCALVIGGRFAHRLFPSVVVAVVVGIVFSRVSGYRGAVVGPIHTAVAAPSFHLPWRHLPHLIVPGLVIALVGFIEPSAIARSFAAAERRPWSARREFVSQGAGNLTSFLVGGFPIGGSFSRSALNRLAGARTTWSGLFAALAVVAFIPFASVLAPLPRAVLAGVVIASVVGQIRLRPLVRLARLSRPQAVVAAVTLVLTLVLAPHIERAVIAGAALAIGLHLYRELQLEVTSWTDDATLHLRPHGVLWFATAPRLEQLFLDCLAAHAETEHLVVHLDGLGRLDVTAALGLRTLLARARDAGVATSVVDVPPRWHNRVADIVTVDEDPLEPARPERTSRVAP